MKFTHTELWKWLRLLFEVFAVAFVMLVAALLIRNAGAEEAGTTCWVLCDPDSYVSLRSGPRKSAPDFGGAMIGAEMQTDGTTRNGYLHVFDLKAEESEGWISAGYIVYDKPEILRRTATVVSNGRLAARKSIGGKIRKWLQPMTTVTIICMSDEWCLTDCGYVMTEFLELDGEDG